MHLPTQQINGKIELNSRGNHECFFRFLRVQKRNGSSFGPDRGPEAYYPGKPSPGLQAAPKGGAAWV
ncbi:hypothetical protein GJAV_G00075060 [Gymnothorax javanicus]|nr:hypothetical protein GJAV_G00075060 [Gymnothorax javanicus]